MGYRPRCIVVLTSAFLLAAGGCANDGSVSVSGSTQEATVKGTVTINGKPATGGEVLFDPSNIKRKDATIKKAAIAKDGSFTITTLIGENSAIVEGPAVKKAGLIMKNRKRVEVKSGENTMDIAIP